MDLSEFEGLKSYEIKNKILQSGRVEDYLNEETIAKFEQIGFKRSFFWPIIIEAGLAEKFLTVENFLKLCELRFPVQGIAKIILASNEQERFKFDWMTKDNFEETLRHVDNYSDLLIYIIKGNGLINEFLNVESIRKYNLNEDGIADLIRQTGDIEKWLDSPEILQFGMDEFCFRDLIVASGNYDKYLTAKQCRKYGLSESRISDLAIKSGRVEEFLKPEVMKEYGLTRGLGDGITDLILHNGNVLEYLTLEKFIELGGFSHINIERLIKRLPKDIREKFLFDYQIQNRTNNYRCSILNIIKGNGGNVEEFIRNQENLMDFGLTFNDIRMALPMDAFNASEISVLQKADVTSAQLVLNSSGEERKRLTKLLEALNNSNSGELRRIKGKIASQILISGKDYEELLKSIEEIYVTDNLPEIAKRFLVFKELHPGFFGERDSLKSDDSRADIPSFNAMNPTERMHYVFSDLLWCALESNDRNIREYLDWIEKGNELFEQLLAGKISISNMDKESSDYKTLDKFSSILNTLYNVNSRVKHSGKERKNTGDLERDLRELNDLFSQDSHIHLNLADRIVRTFGYWAGITSLEQAKEIMNKSRDEAHRRNVEFARRGEFNLELGDYAKGIADTQYIQQMLQKGIVAKDFLGESSKHDRTPMDMDVEKVIRVGETLTKSLQNLKIVSGFTDTSKSYKSVGNLILVFSGEGVEETKNSNGALNDEAISRCLEDKRRVEAFYNYREMSGAEAHGFRTGRGSETIKCMIAREYSPKLGLEIALNGFYIPVINREGKLIYTPEMYEAFREKMQGLSHFGEKHFEVDPSARNGIIPKISDLVSLNLLDADRRRSRVLEVVKSAVEKMGLKLSPKRMLDLKPGIIELIDTGSTGRGTNEPGDGDFDFMVRVDRRLMENLEPIRQALRDVFSSEEEPEKDTEIGASHNFRYKGVKIPGVTKKVDLDLSFIVRTNDIEYSTEESIKDRLSTIREQSEEDYKVVVANILFAKKYLKMSGVYKKKDSPKPENGQMDTRGGLGAVGIENWILQNGGSFEKACSEFLKTAGVIDETGQIIEAQEPIPFSQFNEEYCIWDFGENWISASRDIYPHDNFVDNMTEEGYIKMVKALKEYVIGMSKHKESTVSREAVDQLVDKGMDI